MKAGANLVLIQQFSNSNGKGLTWPGPYMVILNSDLKQKQTWLDIICYTTNNKTVYDLNFLVQNPLSGWMTKWGASSTAT